MEIQYLYDTGVPQRSGAFPAIEFAGFLGDSAGLQTYHYMEESMRNVRGVDQIATLELVLEDLFSARSKGRDYEVSADIEQSVSHTQSSLHAVEESAVAHLMPEDYVMGLLVDVSGSMSGSAIENACKALVAKVEAMEAKGIKTAVWVFNTKLTQLKDANEALTDAVRGKLGGIPAMTEGSTELGWAVYEAAKHLAKRKETVKALTVLTDGVPVESKWPGIDEINSTVGRDDKTQGVLLLGEGVGPGTSGVVKHFPNQVLIEDMDEFAEIDGKALLALITQPDKF